MVPVQAAIDYNVIMNADYSRALLHDKVHLHLKYILGYFDSKWHSLESVPAFVGIDHQ